MPYDRRDILKASGAAVAGSVVTVGAASGDEACTETIETYTIDEIQPGEPLPASPVVASPAVLGNGLVVAFPTESFTIEENAIEGSDLPQGRIDLSMTWNPLDEGPNSADVFLEQQSVGGDWEMVGYAESVRGPQGANHVSLTVDDGEAYMGEDAEGENVSNVAVVSGGRSYRTLIRSSSGVADFEMAVEVQAVDPDCLDDGE